MDYRHIQFCDRRDRIDLVQLQHLLHDHAFWARERCIDDLALALANSDPVVSVWDGDRLVGCARATSDCVYRATIWDVAIHPDYRGAGLGSKLVETVLAHPRVCRVERVYLMTTNQEAFYQRIGFQANTTTTMVLYNQETCAPLPELTEPSFAHRDPSR